MPMSVLVAGVGMIPFVKPGAHASYVEMGARAVKLCLQDSGLSYDSVQQVYAGYVYGDSCCGQRVIYEIGMTGVPVVNVNNNCATGSTAIFLASAPGGGERRRRMRAGGRLRADAPGRARHHLQ
jgi:sterol carrier protein 2